MIDNKNESLPNFKLKELYFHSYHGEYTDSNKLDISKNIQKRLGIIYKLAMEEPKKVPFQIKNEKKEKLESKDCSKFTRVKHEYNKELMFGEKMEIFERMMPNSLKRILDDVVEDIDKFKFGIDSDDEIFQQINDKEKKIVFKIRKSKYIDRKDSFDNINNMSLYNRVYYNFKLLKFLYKNFHKDDFYSTRISLYSIPVLPSLAYLILKYALKTQFLVKYVIPLNFIITSYIFTDTFKEDLKDINFRKRDLSRELKDLSKI